MVEVVILFALFVVVVAFVAGSSIQVVGFVFYFLHLKQIAELQFFGWIPQFPFLIVVKLPVHVNF